MLFKRRNPPAFAERMRVAFWPRRSWSRSLRYTLYRIWRLSGSPHMIALGAAIGVFVAFSPFVGFHFVIAGLLAWMAGGNILAAILGTFMANPLTLPLIWISTYKLGNWVLGEKLPMAQSEALKRIAELSEGFLLNFKEALNAMADTLWPVIKPMALGGLSLGLIAGVLCYYLVKKAVIVYQQKRRTLRPRLNIKSNALKA